MKKTGILVFACLAATFGVCAQQLDASVEDVQALEVLPVNNIVDSLTAGARNHAVVAPYDLREAVFDNYYMGDSLSLSTPLPSDGLFASPAFNWLDDAVMSGRILGQARQRHMLRNPQVVVYNERLLPEPPRKFHIEVDPATAKLVFQEDAIVTSPTLPTDLTVEVRKRHWIRSFDALLQFSQAYISPNWYQGGSNNLTMLLNLVYNVKLNQTYHPTLLCEGTASYKLSIHGTPEDSLRNYNISEDLLQLNGKVGIKAWRNWFYSVTGQFKTQFFKNYEVNSPVMKAAFMSPSELNIGVGVTWGYENKPRRLSMNASISPFSWNMRTCINSNVNAADFGIEPGHKTVHEFGSSGELTLKWDITYNISYSSRLFVFTDYKYLQGDWENTLSFSINKYLSTQLYFHLRYDSSTPRLADSKWHVWQLREVLSFGLAYKFATI